MSQHVLLCAEHPLFAEDPAQLHIVNGKAGVGKTIFLTHLALSYLARGKKVLHLSTNSTQQQKNTYQTLAPQKKDWSLRLLHTRNKSFSPEEVGSIAQQYQDLLSFTADLLIVENVFEEALWDWHQLCNGYRNIWIAPQEDCSIPTQAHSIELLELGSRIAIHSNRSVGRIFLDPRDQKIYEEKTIQHTATSTIYTTGAAGAESCFGAEAEKWGVKEVHFSFEGHHQSRSQASCILDEEKLAKGTVSLHYVSRRLRRTWNKTPLLKKVLQLIWHMVDRAEQVFVVGQIQPDQTVHGGTGWAVELARRWNKDVWVFDQTREAWFFWDGNNWCTGTPTITTNNFAGSGTRFLQESGKKAIEDLFTRSFS